MSTDPRFNSAARDLLIEHIDGTPVTLRFYKKDDPYISHGQRLAMSAKRRLIGALLVAGFLKTVCCEDGVGMETIITEKGRGALAAALADWADAIVRAQSKDGCIPVWADPPIRSWRASK